MFNLLFNISHYHENFMLFQMHNHLVTGYNIYLCVSFPQFVERESSSLVSGYPINRPAYRQAGLGYDNLKYFRHS